MLIVHFIGWLVYRVACALNRWWQDITDPFDVGD